MGCRTMEASLNEEGCCLKKVHQIHGGGRSDRVQHCQDREHAEHPQEGGQKLDGRRRKSLLQYLVHRKNYAERNHQMQNSINLLNGELISADRNEHLQQINCLEFLEIQICRNFINFYLRFIKTCSHHRTRRPALQAKMNLLITTL
ncbi:hypothetical protein KSP39_PZI004706 [Platanthera zijinensis]|uniref:Uncharacterized protein n=1 Tax=Platanthera zijinensis TaxID=2320716 RepID=A0AAP0BWT2_9ASPA